MTRPWSGEFLEQRPRFAVPAAVLVLCAAALGVVLVPPPAAKPGLSPAPLRADTLFGKPPLHFEALYSDSAGPGSHSNEQPHFVARGRGGIVAMAAGTVTLQLAANTGAAERMAYETERNSSVRPGFRLFKPTPSAIAASNTRSTRSASATPATIRMTLPGAKHVMPRGVEPLAGRTHLLVGNDPSHWRRNIPQFAKVRYDQVYDGIDLLLYGNPNELEYDFAIAAGADASIIRLAFDGAQRLRIDAGGDLVLETTAGTIRHRRPRAYQTFEGTERAVPVSYEIDSASTVRFRVSEYDRRYPLVIDPVLAYATYLGGIGTDLGQSIARDSEGSIYITGHTASTDFPRTSVYAPAGSPHQNNSIVFVTKLDAGGTRILYSTLLGGDDFDISNSVAVDRDGSAYIVGETKSANFPVTARAVQRSRGDNSDAFVAKLSPDGSALVYSTYLGGEEIDFANGIAVDAAGAAYITGSTYSKDFPTTSGAYQTRYAASRDVFAAKLSADGSRLLYSTFIGGSGTDLANAVAIDPVGNAYLAGVTDARRANGITDAYCVKLDPAGGKVMYSKLFGGLGHEEATAVAIDAAGNAYVTGATFSKDFPTTARAFQRQSKSPEFQLGSPFGYDAFVVKIDPRGENLLFSTFLNGTRASRGQAIALDPDNNIVVAGHTLSPDFPLTAGALPPPASEELFQGFLTTLNPAGSELVYSTRFGGSGYNQAWDLALDPAGSVYVGGFSTSNDFPTTAGAAQTAHGGAFDAFLVKFSAAGTPVVTAAGIVSGASFLAGSVAPGMIVSIFGSGLGPTQIASLDLDGNGYVKTELHGTRVLFNDVPAPLVFVSEAQVGAVVPYALDGTGTLRLVVECQGLRSTPVELPVSESAPGLFTINASGTGLGAILNQDGSGNTLENAAERGSIVVLFGTGEGQTEPAGRDGKLAAETLPRPRLPVSVTIGGRSAEVLYSGGAPGLVAGVIQVNARVPADLAASGEVPVVLQVGGAASQSGVTLAVR